MDRPVVLFVCPHGAGKSRMAAAWFEALGIRGWAATSAGLHPQTTVSEHAPRLLAGTPAYALLDGSAPRAVSDAPAADVVVAIDCPDTVEATQRWQLTHQRFDAAMCAEIRDRVRAFAETLPTAGRHDR